MFSCQGSARTTTWKACGRRRRSDGRRQRASSCVGTTADALVGTWRLVSWQVIAENGEPQDGFGANPTGDLVLTPEGRTMALTTASGRQAGMGDAERAALHKSMLAYSGKYRVEGDDFITTVDVSWNEEWNGTEQRRHFRIVGDRLFIETAP